MNAILWAVGAVALLLFAAFFALHGEYDRATLYALFGLWAGDHVERDRP